MVPLSTLEAKSPLFPRPCHYSSGQCQGHKFQGSPFKTEWLSLHIKFLSASLSYLIRAHHLHWISIVIIYIGKFKDSQLLLWVLMEPQNGVCGQTCQFHVTGTLCFKGSTMFASWRPGPSSLPSLARVLDTITTSKVCWAKSTLPLKTYSTWECGNNPMTNRD